MLDKNCCILLIAINVIILALVSYLVHKQRKMTSEGYYAETTDSVSKAQKVMKTIVILVLILSAGSFAWIIGPSLLQM